MSNAPEMKKPATRAWSTTDQINYLQGVVRRNGQPINDKGGIVDARKILTNCLRHCRTRTWPGVVNVAAVEQEARLLLESLE